jgi:hypothetical protein
MSPARLNPETGRNEYAAAQVQARFYVHNVSHTAVPNGKNNGPVELYPTTRGRENKTWAQATPSGNIKLTINGNALEWFMDRLGKDVAITFEDRPLICAKCKGELSGDQYGSTTEPVPGTDGTQWQHRAGLCSGSGNA